MKENGTQIPLVAYSTYALVWLALLVLLGATITIAQAHLLAKYSVLAPLAIASAKAGLVLTYFMHLKYEGKFLKTMLIVAVSTLTVFIAFTFVDVWYR